MPDCQKRKNKKQQPSTPSRACGTINNSKYVNNFLSTNPTTLILSSLVSEFDKESKSDFCVCWGGVGEGGEVHSNHLCNVEHVEQSTFQNTRITF